jgi:esterase/lipase superfamily enzyme
VHIQDFRVVAHYSLPAVDARNLLYALTNTPSARSSSPAAAADSIQDEVLVYVHGFLTPFNNAVRNIALPSFSFSAVLVPFFGFALILTE